MDGNIFNSRGVHVAIVRGTAIFDLKGEKLFSLRGINIYKPTGELVGHLTDAHGSEKRGSIALRTSCFLQAPILAAHD